MFRSTTLAFLIAAIVSVATAQQDTVEEIDFVCGGTSVVEQHIKANETLVIGQVPAGLHRLAIHLWSDEDMDIQLMSGDRTVIHWLNGEIYHGETKESTFENDTFVYSGYNGDGFNKGGNEYIIFDGFTTNEYEFQVYANGNDGHITARYGWIPLDTCNITAKYYPNLNELLEGSKAGGRRRLQTKAALHDQIDGHTRISYDAAWTALQRTDQNPSSSSQVISLYTRRGIYKSWRDGSGSTCGGNLDNCWNREHVWSKSRGDFGTTQGAGTDIHALRAEDRSVNTQRSNKNFAAGGTVVPDCSICKETSTSFEPPSSAKGAVARMLFYMATRYNGDSDSNGVNLILQNGNPSDPVGKTGYHGDLAVLKSWNNLYPPSTEEMNRNNIIQSYFQGNRNPFIDNPSLVNSLFYIKGIDDINEIPDPSLNYNDDKEAEPEGNEEPESEDNNISDTSSSHGADENINEPAPGSDGYSSDTSEAVKAHNLFYFIYLYMLYTIVTL